MVFNSDFTENSYLPEKYGNFKQFSLFNILLRLVAFYMFFFSETKGKTNTIIVSRITEQLLKTSFSPILKTCSLP